jgi:hypothetical protein
MTAFHTKKVTKAFLRRHRAACSICYHPDREAIEEEYLHWHDVWKISRQYQIDDYRSIHRHARAYGLVAARRENMLAALDNLVERSAGASVRGDTVIRAIRAYSCISDSGEWAEPPTRVVFSTDRPALPAGVAKRLLRAQAAQDCASAEIDVASPSPATTKNRRRAKQARA